jgi:hypothetical protein
MNAIKGFNHRLNNSFKNDEENTSDLRSQVDLLMESTFKKMGAFDNACIIGAGKMNDFSLLGIIECFSNVLITDVDVDSVRESIEKIKLSKRNRKKITVEEVEYTGFTYSKFFDDFKEKIIEVRDFEKIDQIIDQKLKKIRKYKFLKNRNEHFDFIYISPIYTQLIYQQLLRECSLLRESGYPEHLLKYIENTMLEEMINIIARFNNNVVSLLKNTGTLFVLSDVFQLDVGSDFERRVSNSIRNKDVMEEIYEGYKEKYGMGFGDFGLYNLDELMITDLSRWTIWSFTKNVKFAVKLKIYKKINI